MKPLIFAALTPAPRVAQLRGYRVPLPNPLIDLPLHATERPVLSADMRAFTQTLDAADTMCRYPDGRALEAVLAARLQIDATRVMVTAGLDEALDRACRGMLCPGRNVIVAVPTFEMIIHFAQLSGGDVIEVPWPHGAYPVQAVLSRVTEATRMIAVVSPNNPTGAVATAADVRALAEGAPHALIVLDLAYGEFAEVDLTHAALSHANVVVLHTLSKAWGLPGVRLGYVAGAPEVLGWLRTSGTPYSVPRPSLALAHARLRNGEADMKVYVERVRFERKQLETVLRGLGAQPLPSQANFVFATFANVAWVAEALAGLGIGARRFPHDPSLADALRISCPGDEDAFERLCSALVAVLSPQAILFDMDGVLADVSGSFRQAILATAEEFGVTLSHADIAAAKAAGNANNDWLVTQRLLAKNGVEADLAAVTACFERHYQGDAEHVGLRATERFLCTPQLLAQWAAKWPLAVVTGRPRLDAERFLQEHDIAHHFTHVVCMEDAPLKPDAAPVRLALQKLGVTAAWLIGDTPDDVRAARAAGVVPLGIVAPGDDPGRSAALLLRVGAARVLTSLTELTELLS